MRNYAKVNSRFWVAGTGRRLRGDKDAQILALYLMSCPASNMAGVFNLAAPTMAHETALGEAATRRALARLVEEGFVLVDEAEDLVWVVQAAGLQIGSEKLKEGDNRRKGFESILESYSSSWIATAAWAHYRGVFGLEEPPFPPLPRPGGTHQRPSAPPFEGVQDASEAPSNPLRRGAEVRTEAPIRSAAPLAIQEQDQEQDQEQEQEGTPALVGRPPSEPPSVALVPTAHARPPAQKQGSGLFDAVLSAFCEAWSDEYGQPYKPTPGDRNQLGRLLKSLSPVEANELPDLFRAYLADTEAFIADKQRHCLTYFCASGGLNKYRTRTRSVPRKVAEADALKRHGDDVLDRVERDLIATGVLT